MGNQQITCGAFDLLDIVEPRLALEISLRRLLVCPAMLRSGPLRPTVPLRFAL